MESLRTIACTDDTPLVFLCHASEDKPAVRRYAARLIDAGFRIWLDEENLLPGQDWDAEIRNAIGCSSAVVVFLSPRSQKRGYVQREILRVLDEAERQPEGTIFLIPTKLESCPIPSRLSKWQWVDLESHGGFKKLCAALDTHRSTDASSEIRYLRKFYLGLEPDEEAVIITASHRHVAEGYSSKPDCDITVADQVRMDLRKIRVKSKVVPDDTALKDAEAWRVRTLILICGPIGNRFTRYVYENSSDLGRVFSVVGDKSRTLIVGGREFASDDPAAGVGNRIEHAFIGRFKNPWQRDRYIFLLFGLQPLGTSAIGQFLTREGTYERLTSAGNGKEVAFVLPIRYSKYDGDGNFEFQLESEIKVL